MRYFPVALLILLSANFSLFANGPLTVVITGIRLDSGENIAVQLFPGQEDYESRVVYAQQSSRLPGGEESFTFVFDSLPPGEYALLGLRDSNGNNEMDMNFFSIPNEGYFAFNNPGRPDYENSHIDFNGQKLHLELVMIYY